MFWRFINGRLGEWAEGTGLARVSETRPPVSDVMPARARHSKGDGSAYASETRPLFLRQRQRHAVAVDADRLQGIAHDGPRNHCVGQLVAAGLEDLGCALT